MRIFVASGTWIPDSSGPSTHLAALVPWLRDRGHDVRVLTYGAEDAIDGSAGVTTIALARPLVGRELAYARAYRSGAAWADVIYVTSLGLPRWFGPARPVVLRVPGDRAWERAINRGFVPPDEDLDTFQRRAHPLRVRLLKWQRAREARRARSVIVPSRYVRDLVLGWGVDGACVQVVPSFVAQPVRPIGREEARRALAWDPHRRHLLAAARLTRWKGIDLLIDALADRPGIRLIVAGDGPDRARLETRAARARVEATFAGTLDREALDLHMAACDYVVVYSSYEGLSHTILEAFQQGTPVIASRRGGNPEAVQHDIDGLLVEHPDVRALAGAIDAAFDTGTRARLAAGAQRAAEAAAPQAAMETIAGILEAASRQPSNGT